MTFTRIERRFGKSKRAKVYLAEIPAVTTVAIRRYNCGMTVGHGWYHVHAHTDPVGSECGINGWWDDGTVTVRFPGGGCGRLGRADVEITSWPEFTTDEQRAQWAALPRVSRVDENGDTPEARAGNEQAKEKR
jgi:predicted Fe-S protein YdhL (DUF1289 family)